MSMEVVQAVCGGSSGVQEVYGDDDVMYRMLHWHRK